MLQFYRLLRSRTDQFAVLLDREHQRVVVTRWNANSNRIERLRVDAYLKSHPEDTAHQARVLAEAVAFAKDALQDSKARRRAEQQVVAQRVDARAGTCVVCGGAMRAHFDAENRKLTCAQARRAEETR